MKSVALITEYNPFHNGHKYHAEQAKKVTQADISIAIMSGQFVMRGMPALYSKFQRAKMASTEIDLVVELPLIGSLSSSDTFAEMGIKVAEYLDADSLCFGSESGDISTLQKVAQKLVAIEKTPEFKTLLKEGKSYARIISEQTNESVLKYPNNTLGISYLKQLINSHSSIQPYTIKRVHSEHHQHALTHDSFASGSAIRQDIINNGKEWMSMVPNESHPFFIHPFTNQNRLFRMLQLSIYQRSKSELQNIYTMSEGFENRLHQAIRNSTDYENLMQNLKTKRYTYTHIQRLLMNILLNVKYSDVDKTIQGVRILAMTSQGRQYLKTLKQRYTNRFFITNVNKQNAHFFHDEIKATHVYNLLTDNEQDDFNTPVFLY
ncbi:nucleotidyltransferase [Staphylococcus canis]|uniref:tRNA(Met) cytidine acetate ligase n=1 Tax=Staphylococcus canis TaxID=2724942 RepID=A0ABS0T6X6_9STAP|nr:nucleotidyltransferase [Staphylococcus canis]